MVTTTVDTMITMAAMVTEVTPLTLGMQRMVSQQIITPNLIDPLRLSQLKNSFLYLFSCSFFLFKK